MSHHQNFSYTFAFTFFSVSAWWLITMPSAYQSEVDFKNHAISTLGTVEKIEVEEHWMSVPLGASYRKLEYTSTIQFETLEGKSATLSHSTSTRLKDKQVPILYNPTDPNQTRVGTEVNPKNTVYGHLLASTFFLTGSMYTFYLARRCEE
jgi:hypothetical protein